MRYCLGIFYDILHVYGSSYVNSTVADEDAYF